MVNPWNQPQECTWFYAHNLYSDFFANPEFEQMKKQKKSWAQLSGQTNPFGFEVSYQILGVNNRKKFSKFLLLTRCIPFWLNIMSTLNIKAQRLDGTER